MNLKKISASVLCLIIFTQTALATGGLTFEESISRPVSYALNENIGQIMDIDQNLISSGTNAQSNTIGKVTFYKGLETGEYTELNTIEYNNISSSPNVSSHISFGKSVSTHQNLAIVGAHLNITPSRSFPGNAYIFEYDENTNQFLYSHTLQKNLNNPLNLGNNTVNDRFGDGVSIFQGDGIKFASVNDSFGKEVMIYEDDGNGWTAVFNTGNLGQYTTSSNIEMSWPNIDMNSEYLVAALNTNSNSVSRNNNNNVVIFKRTNGLWNFHQNIEAPTSTTNSHFSNDISLSSDNKLAVGAYNHNDVGAVFIYEINPSNGQFELEQLLNESNSGNSNYGFSVDINSSNLVVGNIVEDIVYKYTKNNIWTLDQTIEDSDMFALGVGTATAFGIGIGIYDDTMIVSTPYDQLAFHRYSFINLSNDGEPIPEFNDYVLFSVILISGFAIFRRLPSIRKSK